MAQDLDQDQAALEALLTALEAPPRDGPAAQAQRCEQALLLFQRVGRPDPLRRAAVELMLGQACVALARGGVAGAGARAVAAFGRGVTLVSPQTASGLWLSLLMEYGTALIDFPTSQGDLEEALGAFDRVVRTVHPNDPQTRESWALAHANLAFCYLHRTAGDAAENIFRSTVSGQLAAQVYDAATHRVARARVLLNLGTAQRRSIRGSRAQNVEDAIASHSEALKLWSQHDEPVDWAETAANLGNDFADRVAGERAENMRQSIGALSAAARAFSAAQRPLKWALTLTNLAPSYLERIDGDPLANVATAIAMLDEVGELLQDRAPEIWARALFWRSTALARRAGGNAAQTDDLAEAIRGFETALVTFSRDRAPRLWATTHVRLAEAHASNASRAADRRAAELATARDHLERALGVFARDVYPLDWARTTATLAAVDLAAAAPGEEAETIAFASYRDAFATIVSAGVPTDVLVTGRAYADALADRGRFPESLEPYRIALNAAEELYRASLSRIGKEAELDASRGLAQRAAYAFARAGDARFAAVVLERNRARWINDALERDRAAVERLATTDPALFAEYCAAAARVRNVEAIEAASATNEERRSETIDPSLRAEAVRARAAYESAVQRVAARPDFGPRFRFPTFEDLAAAVRPDRPLVYLTATPRGGLAIVLAAQADGATGAGVVLLAAMTTGWLADLAREWLPAAAEPPRTESAWHATVDAVSARLWAPLAEPLVAYLRAGGASRATIVPCGALAFMPLHAAFGTDEDGTRTYALDGIVLSYAPSARALVRAARVTANAEPALLAVVEPWPVKARPLTNAGPEADAVTSTFVSVRTLRREDATRAAVLAALPAADVAHFTCHGFGDHAAPRRSAVVLANDEFLTVADLFALDLQHARLATLSACETATTGPALPDESVSLAEAFVRAGFAGVIASLWPVADGPTAMLIARFYERLNAGAPEGLATARPDVVLRDAARWLRDATNGEKAAYFASFLPELGATPDSAPAGRMSRTSAGTFYRALAFEDPAERAHAHPFFWAAFSYVGV